MGTNTHSPQPPHERLGEFYRVLQTEFGLDELVVETDYRFESVKEASEIVGFFFGDRMGMEIQKSGLLIVPEWTGIWHGVRPFVAETSEKTTP